MSLSKEQAMDIHVKKRFKERFNFKCTDDDIKHIIHMIKSNEREGVEPIYKQTNTKTVWKITYKDMTFLAIYHKGKHRLSTVMPLEYLKTLKYHVDTSEACDEDGIELGITSEEKMALDTTIQSLDSILLQLEAVKSDEVICVNSLEHITKDDIDVCKQILQLITDSDYLEISSLQTDELVL